MAPNYKLTYFNQKGRGEPIRIMFAVAGVAYTDHRVEWPEWCQIKSEVPFGKMPILTIDKDTVICQSGAICAYVAKQYGFDGKSDLDKARVIMVAECINDTWTPLAEILPMKSEEEKAARVKKYETEDFPVYLKNLERLLVSNKGGGGFFVGSKLTYADIKLLAVFEFADWQKVKFDATLCPKLLALRQRVSNIPKIKDWIAKRPVTLV